MVDGEKHSRQAFAIDMVREYEEEHLKVLEEWRGTRFQVWCLELNRNSGSLITRKILSLRTWKGPPNQKREDRARWAFRLTLHKVLVLAHVSQG